MVPRDPIAYLSEKRAQETAAVTSHPARRHLLTTFASTAAIGAIGLASAVAKPLAAAVESAPLPPGATHLDAIKARLARAPRRHDLKTVPMILRHPEQWHHEALTEVARLSPRPKASLGQYRYRRSLAERDAQRAQFADWSFKHLDFLVVSVTYGAQLALYDQAAWDKDQLTRLAGEAFKTDTLIIEQKAAAADTANYEDPSRPFSGEDNSMPAAMRRGMVFMSCHNAIWEQAAALIKAGINPDKLSHPALAAELTNHLVDGAVLILGAAGTLPELQQAGFYYAA
jgi:hypothetical protein